MEVFNCPELNFNILQNKKFHLKFYMFVNVSRGGPVQIT
jgi:hypothetical protein